MSDVMVGAYSAYATKITPAQKSLLEKAVGLGVSYSPFAVATQVVSGTNYRFLCNAKVIKPNAPLEAKLVQFYVPIGSETPGEVEIQNISCK